MAKIEIYTAMLCSYCASAKTLLKKKCVAFSEIDVTMNPEKRSEMIDRSGGRSSVPQIFVDGDHIGDCDDLYDLEFDGKLDALLAAPESEAE